MPSAVTSSQRQVARDTPRHAPEPVQRPVVQRRPPGRRRSGGHPARSCPRRSRSAAAKAGSVFSRCASGSPPVRDCERAHRTATGRPRRWQHAVAIEDARARSGRGAAPTAAPRDERARLRVARAAARAPCSARAGSPAGRQPPRRRRSPITWTSSGRTPMSTSPPPSPETPSHGTAQAVGELDHAVADGALVEVHRADEARDEARRRLAVQRRAGPRTARPCRPHDGDPVGDRQRLLLVVGHEDGGDAEPLLELADLLAHAGRAAWRRGWRAARRAAAPSARCTSARASATRCCWPPESCAG